ncbi:MAG: peptide ABC transporter substrate-binding protein [Myxococcota bacterium]|nr:peptide ABC transporter substrate-binding protein [Myxococcota bacterium]
MLRSLLGILLVFVCGLLAVGVTFSASSQERAEFAFINPVEPRSLDPTRINGEPEGRVLDALFEGLTYLDAKSLRPAPGMAESWEISADGRRYVFRIRKSARWSDGHPVTAHDFCFAWRRLLDPSLGAEYAGVLFPVRDAEAYNTYASRADSLEQPIAKALSALGRAHPERIPSAAFRAFASEQHLEAAVKGSPNAELVALLKEADAGLPSSRLPLLSKALASEAQRLRSEGALAEQRFGRETGVVAADDHTLIVELNAPTPYFLELTAFYPTYPVPRWVVERPGLGETWFLPENIVSNGPFRLASWRVGDRIRMEKSETYWDKDRVRLKSVDALPIENGTTALNMYLTGQADWMPTNSFPADLIDELKKRPDFNKGPALAVYYYRVNTTRKPFNDPRVRKALSMAIDREVITRDVLAIGQEPTFRLVPPGIAGYEPPVPELRYDLAQARALLAEAGFPGGKGFPKFGILFNTMEAHKKIAEVIADQWKRGLGIEANGYNQEWQAYQATTQLLDYDLSRAAWIGDYEDPNTFLELYVTNGGNNQTGWGSRVYDQLIAAAGDVERFLKSPGALLPELREREKIQALIDAALAEQEPAAHLVLANRLRMALFREAEALLINDAVPIIPIYFYVNNGLVKPRVHGFYKELHDPDGKKRPNLRDRHPLREVWVEDGEAHGP